MNTLLDFLIPTLGFASLFFALGVGIWFVTRKEGTNE